MTMESSGTITTVIPSSNPPDQVPPPPSSDILHDLRPMLLIYKDGRIERLMGNDTVPPNPTDDVVPSKDVQISPDVSARLYLPKSTPPPNQTKLPLLIFFHGGGFAIESASSPTYHNYLSSLASKSSAVIISVNYRLVPEHPLPAAYDDCWFAVKWAISASNPDPWITDHADLSRIYFAGDSAGANIAHHMGIRFGKEKLIGFDTDACLSGLVLVHPFFLGEEPIFGDNGPETVAGREFGRRFWAVICDDPNKGLDHPWINPEKDGELGKMGCERVLVAVAEKDSLRNRGIYYAVEVLGKSGEWGGKVEVFESKGEGHVFFLFKPGCENAVEFMEKFVGFING